jgi:hypothetical protein
MKKLTDGERVRRAMATGDTTELEWALGYTRERLEAADSDSIRRYWIEIVRRVEEALFAAERGA